MRKLSRISKKQRLEELSVEPENAYERKGSLLHEVLIACTEWDGIDPIILNSREYEVNLEGEIIDPNEASHIKQEIDYVITELTDLGWTANIILNDTQSFSRFYELTIS